MKEIYEMKGAGRSIRGDCPGAGRVPQHGTPVRLPAQGQVLKSPEAMRPRPPPRGSKLDPYAEHIDRRDGGRAGELPGVGSRGPGPGVPGQLLDGGAVCAPAAAAQTA